MKSFKKTIRVVGFALLIILASFGVGISGGIAIPVSRRREDKPITIELVESKEDQSDDSAEEFKP